MRSLIAVLALALSTSAVAANLTYRLRVDGLACAYCAYRIEKAFMTTRGVEQVDIDFEQGNVLVDAARDVTFSEAELRRIVNDSGFTLRGVERLEGGAK